jgi:hypothetical protein
MPPVPPKVEPADFVVPLGPAIIYVKVNRDAFKHLDPDMKPLTDADSISTVNRKGKVALEEARRGLSAQLFGADVPREMTTHFHPAPGVSVTSTDSEPLLCSRYLGFFWKRDFPAGETPAVIDLTSDAEPVDGCIRFHAVEIANERERRDRIAQVAYDDDIVARIREEGIEAVKAALPPVTDSRV